MRKNCVAVLDIRSSEICAIVGERGVNNTFIIKNKYACPYDGYAEGEIIDEENFRSAVADAVGHTLDSAGGKIKTFFVGVAGEFLDLVNVDRSVSFQSVKKITYADCRALTKADAPDPDGKWRTIRHGCMYYVLSDKRKLINPVGSLSDSLQGKCCFYRCKKQFAECVRSAFAGFNEIETVKLVPMNYAQAMYLVEPERRDENAVLFDFGYISSTYSVICGNGLLYSESFSLGIGHIAYYISSELEIPFEDASELLTKINLNSKEKRDSADEYMLNGKIYKLNTSAVRELIREGFDGVCETIEECKNNFTGANIDGKPLLLTGEGVSVVRGTVEHLAGRLEKSVETVAPKVPFYHKPQFSSAFSLLNTALEDSE